MHAGKIVPSATPRMIGTTDICMVLQPYRTQHFCETCNRVRLTVDGILHLCLGQEERMDFRTLMRGGATDKEITEAIRLAIDLKPERHEFTEAPQKLVRFMSMTGG